MESQKITECILVELYLPVLRAIPHKKQSKLFTDEAIAIDWYSARAGLCYPQCYKRAECSLIERRAEPIVCRSSSTTATAVGEPMLFGVAAPQDQLIPVTAYPRSFLS